MTGCFSLISFDDILLISVIVSLHNFKEQKLQFKTFNKEKKSFTTNFEMKKMRTKMHRIWYFVNKKFIKTMTFEIKTFFVHDLLPKQVSKLIKNCKKKLCWCKIKQKEVQTIFNGSLNFCQHKRIFIHSWDS